MRDDKENGISVVGTEIDVGFLNRPNVVRLVFYFNKLSALRHEMKWTKYKYNLCKLIRNYVLFVIEVRVILCATC